MLQSDVLTHQLVGRDGDEALHVRRARRGHGIHGRVNAAAAGNRGVCRGVWVARRGHGAAVDRGERGRAGGEVRPRVETGIHSRLIKPGLIKHVRLAISEPSQRWAVKWVFVCALSPSATGGSQEAAFTQPRAHLRPITSEAFDAPGQLGAEVDGGLVWVLRGREEDGRLVDVCHGVELGALERRVVQLVEPPLPGVGGAPLLRPPLLVPSLPLRTLVAKDLARKNEIIIPLLINASPY